MSGFRREGAFEAPHLDAVRTTCADVAGRAEHVAIDEERLGPYAEALAAETSPTEGALDPDLHFVEGTAEDTVAFVLVLDTVNFGSGWFPELDKDEGRSGYETIAGRLTEHCRAHGVPSPEDLTTMPASRCHEIFRQPDTPAVAELMGLFAQALCDLGTTIAERYGGAYVHLVEAADHRADAVVAALTHMPFFRDVATYRGQSASFFKRAQITVSDLSLALGGEGWGAFVDLDRLTMFADNVVPHVLRTDGILAYDEQLAERIAAGELIPSGAPEEVELRACAVTAVEQMAAHLRARGLEPATARRLDMALWERGRGARYKSRPRHRTRCVSY